MTVCKHGCDMMVSVKYCTKAIHVEDFFRVYIASSNHERGWENSRQLLYANLRLLPNPPSEKGLYCLILFSAPFVTLVLGHDMCLTLWTIYIGCICFYYMQMLMFCLKF